MLEKYTDIQTTDFKWGGHSECELRTEHLSFHNHNQGLQTSSFYLREGFYNVVVSNDELDMICDEYFSGVPRISGTDEERRFMHEYTQGWVDKYSLSNDKLSCFFSGSKFDMNKKVFIYLTFLSSNKVN